MSTLKKFKYIERVFVDLRWDTANKIRDMFDEGKLTLVEDSLSGRYNFETINLSKDRTWSTYDRCREGMLTIEDGKIVLKLKYYNGSILDGHRENIRWKASFIGLNGKSISLFKKEIDRKFNDEMHHLYDLEEDLKRKNRVKELEEEILK